MFIIQLSNSSRNHETVGKRNNKIVYYIILYWMLSNFIWCISCIICCIFAWWTNNCFLWFCVCKDVQFK